MRSSIIILLLFTFCTCSNAQERVYDESNYILVRVDSTNQGLDKKFYVYKYDTARIMIIHFYYDGMRLDKAFAYHNQLDGPAETYSFKGEIIGIDSFSNGKKIHSKTFYKVNSPPLKVFKNGKLQRAKDADIDSLLKK